MTKATWSSVAGLALAAARFTGRRIGFVLLGFALCLLSQRGERDTVPPPVGYPALDIAPNGASIVRTLAGFTVSATELLDGVPHGRYEDWYETTRKPQTYGWYLHGKKDGAWLYFDSNGVWEKTEVYRSDVLVCLFDRRNWKKELGYNGD